MSRLSPSDTFFNSPLTQSLSFIVDHFNDPLRLANTQCEIMPKKIENELMGNSQCLEQTKAHLPSGTRALVVADRECDIYEYFECAQDLDLDVLVRLQH
ncbi:MAG TPA: hypothetical protein VNJ08_05225, partial [Bacteriovoracaceae bacterium]|nr:hypothetical protein [Bacteriovoracaceae bacterium]